LTAEARAWNLYDGGVVLRMSKVAVGPMTDEEAASISEFGDIGRFADALRSVVEDG
jgi:hypothetical protein